MLLFRHLLLFKDKTWEKGSQTLISPTTTPSSSLFLDKPVIATKEENSHRFDTLLLSSCVGLLPHVSFKYIWSVHCFTYDVFSFFAFPLHISRHPISPSKSDFRFFTISPLPLQQINIVYSICPPYCFAFLNSLPHDLEVRTVFSTLSPTFFGQYRRFSLPPLERRFSLLTISCVNANAKTCNHLAFSKTTLFMIFR